MSPLNGSAWIDTGSGSDELGTKVVTVVGSGTPFAPAFITQMQLRA